MNPSWWQYLLPQHLISRSVGLLANSHNEYIKSKLIDWAINKYHIDLSDYEIQNKHDFKTFNDMFTRRIDMSKRPIAETGMASPADGAISEYGKIKHDKIIQAKNHDYSIQALLAGYELEANKYLDGDFITVYLSPKDYHRVHMPFDGNLLKTLYVPGKLFSVNTLTAQTVPSLFARNERLVCFFENDQIGEFVLILVGAICVAGIETVWSGEITPVGKRIIEKDYRDTDIQLNKGDSMGLFKFGSTAIVLTRKDQIKWNELTPHQSLKMGESLAEIN